MKVLKKISMCLMLGTTYLATTYTGTNAADFRLADLTLTNEFGRPHAQVEIHPDLAARIQDNPALLGAVRTIISGDDVRIDQQLSYRSLFSTYAKFNRTDLMDWFVEHNPDVTQLSWQDNLGPLPMAAESNSVAALQWLVQKNQEYMAANPGAVSLITQDASNEMFRSSARELRIEVMEYLMQDHVGMPRINQRGINWGITDAARRNRPGVFNWIITKHTQNPDLVPLPDRDGVTNAFSFAGENNHFAVLDLMLNQADANILLRPTQTAIDCALGYDARKYGAEARPAMAAYLQTQADLGRIPAVAFLPPPHHDHPFMNMMLQNIFAQERAAFIQQMQQQDFLQQQGGQPLAIQQGIGGVDVHERSVVKAVSAQLSLLKADEQPDLFTTSKAWIEREIQSLPEEAEGALLNISSTNKLLALRVLSVLGAYNDIYGYAEHAITYQDLYSRIISRIHKISDHAQQFEAIKTFSESLASMSVGGALVCNTGQVTRALTALHPYYDDLKQEAARFSRESFDIQLDILRDTIQARLSVLGEGEKEVAFNDIKTELVENFKTTQPDLYDAYSAIFDDYVTHITYE